MTRSSAPHRDVLDLEARPHDSRAGVTTLWLRNGTTAATSDSKLATAMAKLVITGWSK